MKKLITLAVVLFIGISSFSQQKQDSLVLEIRMDTAVYKNMLQLIQENINGNTLTGKMVLQNIFYPLQSNIKLVPRNPVVADKPKEVPLKTKP